MQDVVSWPIPASERVAFVYLERARLGRDGHAPVAEMDGKSHAQIPVGRTSAIMLGPWSSMTHEAARLCAEEGALVLWVGEHGVRMYASGNPRADAAALSLPYTRGIKRSSAASASGRAWSAPHAWG